MDLVELAVNLWPFAVGTVLVGLWLWNWRDKQNAFVDRDEAIARKREAIETAKSYKNNWEASQKDVKEREETINSLTKESVAKPTIKKPAKPRKKEIEDAYKKLSELSDNSKTQPRKSNGKKNVTKK